MVAAEEPLVWVPEATVEAATRVALFTGVVADKDAVVVPSATVKYVPYGHLAEMQRRLDIVLTAIG